MELHITKMLCERIEALENLNTQAWNEQRIASQESGDLRKKLSHEKELSDLGWKERREYKDEAEDLLRRRDENAVIWLKEEASWWATNSRLTKRIRELEASLCQFEYIWHTTEKRQDARVAELEALLCPPDNTQLADWEPDWDEAPPEAIFWAADSTLDEEEPSCAFWYAKHPVRKVPGKVWMWDLSSDAGNSALQLIWDAGEVDLGPVDWRTTLRRRPNDTG